MDAYPMKVEPGRTVTIGALIDLARQLGPEGEGLPRQDGPEYSARAAEYTRGIVELITDAAGLPSDFKDEVTRMITENETGLSKADLDKTMAATFLEKPDRYGPELPVIEVAGILVFVYVKDGKLRVSVSLDTADEDMTHGPDKLVPMQIDVQNDTVFEAD